MKSKSATAAGMVRHGTEHQASTTRVTIHRDQMDHTQAMEGCADVIN